MKESLAMQEGMSCLIEMLRLHVQNKPKDTLYCYIDLDLDIRELLTYQSLLEKVILLGNRLKMIAQPGDRIVVAHLADANFIVSFLACLYAGLIAVPCFPPTHFSASTRFKSVCADCKPKYILASASLEPRFKKSIVPLLLTDYQIFTDNKWNPRFHEVAFLQYTSGSTGDPKGVVITQKNLDANLKMINENFGHSEKSVGFIWLPPSHDMGLIGGVLQPLYVGFPVYLLPPQLFLQDPLCWLKGISKFQATTSGAPNFAYALVTELLTQNKKIDTIDLSSWDVAFNGSEPIHIDTMNKFIKATESLGFRREAVHPCYGLAEATLFVTGKPKLTNPKVTSVTIKNLTGGKKCTLIDIAKGENKDCIVSSGAPAKEVLIEIHDPETDELYADNKIGEIWINSPAIAKGYWQNNAATEKSFIGDHWLKSGDLGCIIENELLVTGRIKDLIIYHGVNYYPHDIEYTASMSHPALGAIAAFSIAENEEEKLILIVELKSKNKNINSSDIFKKIRDAVFKEHEIPIYKIILISARSLVKTTSGKIARSTNKKLWQENKLEVIDQWQASEKQQHHATFLNDVDTPLIIWLSHYLENHFGIKIVSSLDASLSQYDLDSISIFKLSSDLSKFLNRPINPHIFWESKNIAELVHFLEQETMVEAPPFPKASSSGPLPLAPNENWLWQLIHKDPDNPVYTICISVDIMDVWQEAAFIKSWQTLIKHETTLRSFFKSDENGIVSRWIAAESDWTPRIRNLTQLTKEEQEVLLRKEMAQLRKHKFDYSAPSQFEITIFILGSNHWLMGLAISHLITDGWSMGLLLEKFNAHYKALLSNNNVAYEASPQYANYALWQKQILASDYLNEHKKFLHKELVNSVNSNLLVSDKNVPFCSIYHFSYGDVETAIIENNARESGYGLHSYALSAWIKAIKKYFPSNKITLKLLSAMRHRPETMNMLGFIANGLLFTLDFSAQEDEATFLKRVHDKLIEVIRYQDYPFDLLNELRGVAEHESCHFCFNWHNYAVLENKNGQLPFKFRYDLLPGNEIWSDKTAVACQIFLTKDTLYGRINYIEESISATQIEEIVGKFTQSLMRS